MHPNSIILLDLHWTCVGLALDLSAAWSVADANMSDLKITVQISLKS